MAILYTFNNQKFHFNGKFNKFYNLISDNITQIIAKFNHDSNINFIKINNIEWDANTDNVKLNNKTIYHNTKNIQISSSYKSKNFIENIQINIPNYQIIIKRNYNFFDFHAKILSNNLRPNGIIGLTTNHQCILNFSFPGKIHDYEIQEY